jgi:integrase
VRNICRRIGIDPITPHGLRHSFGTRVRAASNYETSRIGLGHHVGGGVTEVYAEKDRAKAPQSLQRIG